MILSQSYESCLSQASYLIADEKTGQAVVVDPLRDIDQYLDAAREHGLTIVGVILTHFHADFVAGHLELAKVTGAWIGLGERAKPEYEARLLADGERISLGDVTLEIMATPGHTPESISVLVYEHDDDEIAYGVLSGDALFVGDVGRVDLQAIFGADPDALAHEQFDTIQGRFMSLPDAVRLYPGHGAGSACGKNISQERDSTIGHERETNIACQPMTENDFVSMIRSGQPPVPAYFSEDAALNRQAHGLFLATPELPRLSADGALAARRREGVVVLDTRDVETFVGGHIPGSLNVPLKGRFAETAGMFLNYHGASVILVSTPGTEIEAMRRLARVGFDSVAGYVPDAVLRELAEGSRLEVTERIEATDVEAQRASDVVFLDVRGPGEYEDGAIPGSINIPLPQLGSRIDELSRDSRLVVNCASGWRSGVATSYLLANGFGAADVRGGYQAYEKMVAAR